MRTWDKRLFAENGIEAEWVQENHSMSVTKGVVRGFHFQFPPFTEAKLVRCVSGSILDVWVDLRAGSPTFGRWESIELNSENMKMIFIPRGCAHGFCTLSDNVHVIYKVDNYYTPEEERGILWSDTELSVPWPGSGFTVSAKDRGNMTFREFKEKFGGLEL